MTKKAFITGIAGQDGSYLSEHLLEQGYEVYGIVRRNSTPEHQQSRIDHIRKEVNVEYADLTDKGSIDLLLHRIKPDEIYNIAAQSHVGISFQIPFFTVQCNAIGALNILESYRMNCPKARFYQASSSEMFGNSLDEDDFQRESTPMHPVSPYGCSKLFAFNLVRHYRIAYNLFACNGILFNHESPRRGSNFVTNKVVKGAVMIKKGLQNKLELGNLDSYRDWGHSKDYVRAMNMIINHSIADDFIVATGQTHSVRELCTYVFDKLGLNYEDYVIQNPKFLRPHELKYLKGDSAKFRSAFNWKPAYDFSSLLDEMIDHWNSVLNKNG